MSQYGSRQRSKRAKVAKQCVFQNMCFVKQIAVDFEHRVSEESSKRAQKPLESNPESV